MKYIIRSLLVVAAMMLCFTAVARQSNTQGWQKNQRSDVRAKQLNRKAVRRTQRRGIVRNRNARNFTTVKKGSYKDKNSMPAQHGFFHYMKG